MYCGKGRSIRHGKTDSDLRADRLYELLYALPAGVLRAKGFFANRDSGEMYEFHYVPRTSMMGPVQGEVPGVAVVIGEGLDEEDLRRKLQACEA